MHNVVNKIISIKNEIQQKINLIHEINYNPNIIAVSKTFPMSEILPLINDGHIHFGENKIQEAIDKWTDIKQSFDHIKLHMIGKLQTNKVKSAVKLFDYIHSVDSEKLAKKIADEQEKISKKVKIFIQVNISNEEQKSGIKKNELNHLISYCKKINLDVIGLMCLPPADINSSFYFKEMNLINTSFGLSELSMGMSSDYIEALKNSASYLRIGSSIFGKRF